jgi:hypothetical protein
MEENTNPTRNEKGIMNNELGNFANCKIEIINNIIEALITLLVDPQSISPKITSSRLIGVLIIASNVFW